MAKIRTIVLCLLALVFVTSEHSQAQAPAKKLFGNKTLPAALKPAAHGFYTKGCLSGGIAIPVDGPNWQAMRLSRNRRWGHPSLIRIIEDLSYKAKADGWNGLMVGDISQPRGGPMLTGHKSHQMGLDADIWFNPMPKKRLTYKEREETSAVSVLKRGSVYVDKNRWTRAHTMVLYHAASYPEVERVLVHPGVKKQLCETVRGNRAWLNKIRPIWGHHYHFHIRIGCPNGSTDCKRQNPTGTKTGCNDGSLDWWFNVAFAPKKKTKKKPDAKKKTVKKKPKRPRYMTLNDLPQACRLVLDASSPSLQTATYRPRDASFTAPQIDLPAFSAAAVLKGKPIEASKVKSAKGKKALPSVLAIPTPRPR